MSESPDAGASLGRTAFELQRIWESVPHLCGICQFVAGATEQHVDGLFYENVNDPPTRDAIRSAGGFCCYHADFVARQADALGTAIILRDVLTNELRAIEGGKYHKPANSRIALGNLLDRGQENDWEREFKCRPCSICDYEREITEMAIDSLLEGFANPAFSKSFRASDGLCVAHFQLAFTRAGGDTRWGEVLETEKAGLQRLTNQLAELARKRDYRFKDEPRGEEMASWHEALNVSSSWVRRK